MIDDKKTHSDDKKNNNPSGQNFNQVNEQKNVELTEEQRRQRALEAGKLFEDKEDLIQARAEREKKKKGEIVELQSGFKFTIGEVGRLISFKPQPYDPLFSYEYPYLKELYRIYYPDRNYKEYPKPYYVSVLFKELFYGRYDKSIFSALDALNPLIKGKKGRERKLFQYFNSTGRAEAEQYRDQNTKVMETIADSDPYSFRKKMWEIYKIPYQLDFFKEK